MNYSYNDWYIKADQAWTQVEDLEHEQAALELQEPADSIRYDEIELELKEWKEAAEYAEKMMEELEKCQDYPNHCQPAKELTFPLLPKPWMNVGVRMEDGSVSTLT